MTMIMTYCGKGMLLMMGDLMLSQQTPVVTSPLLPSRPAGYGPISNEYLAGLQQKVFQINPNLAVAWAGSALVARSILQDINARFEPPYTGARLLEFINSLELSNSEKEAVASIFAMFVDQPGDFSNMQVQDYLTKEYRNPADTSEFFKFAGSGEYHFFETIEFSIKAGNEEATPYLQNMAGVIGRAGIAFLRELTGDDPHNSYYGGCFEVLTPHIDGFIKFPLQFLVWTYDDGRLDLTGPIFIQQYDGEGRLGIRRFILQADGTWIQDLFRANNFFHQGAGQFDPNNCSDALWSIHYFVDRNPPNSMHMLQETGSDKACKVELKDGQLTVNWREEFVEQFRQVTGTKPPTA